MFSLFWYFIKIWWVIHSSLLPNFTFFNISSSLIISSRQFIYQINWQNYALYIISYKIMAQYIYKYHLLLFWFTDLNNFFCFLQWPFSIQRHPTLGTSHITRWHRNSIYKIFNFLDGYSFVKSPFEFFPLMLIRSILLLLFLLPLRFYSNR